MRNILAGLAWAFFALGTGGCFDSGESGLELESVKREVESGSAVLIDTREIDEWNRGHLENAVFLPLSLLKDEEAKSDLGANIPKDKTLYLHCQAGARAKRAEAILNSRGYRAKALKAGYPDLLEAGFPKSEGR